MHPKEPTLDRFARWIVRNRILVMVLVVTGTLAMSFGALRIRTDVILMHMVPYDHPFFKLQMRFAQVFGGGGSSAAIAVKAKQGDIFNTKTLTKIKKITDEVALWDEVYRILTISMASPSAKVVQPRSKGEIAIEPLMWPEVPDTPAEIELLKKHVFSNPAFNGTLVSRDGTSALILTQFKEDISYEKAFQLLRGLQTRFDDAETSIHVVGYPMLMGWIYSYKAQMYVVFGLSVAFMVVILFAIFRNVVGLVAPLGMAAICTGLGLGFIGWTGINFSPLLYVLAFLIGARMVSNSVQITHRYIEEFHRTGDNYESTYHTVKAMLIPNLAAVATEVVGFLVVGIAKIVLMQQLAIMMSFWMATIVLSGAVVPLLCSFCPIKKREADEEWKKERWIARANLALARFSVGSGRYVIMVGALAVLLVGGWQTTRLKVGDPTPGSPILWPNHPYNQDQAVINEAFDASSEMLVLFYEGKRESVYDPAVLNTFEAFARHMENRLPDIYKSSGSLATITKTINLTFHDGDLAWFQLPRNPEMLRGLLGYVRETLDKGTLGRFVDPTLERAQATLFFSDHTSDNMLRIKKAAYDFFRNHSWTTEEGRFHLAGGAIGMEIALNEEMERSHVIMDSAVLFAIFVMCALTFRSVVAGLMLTLPLVLSNLVAFGYMALTNIGLSTNTLPCSAVGVGVGVDFAIYLYCRCVEEFPHHRDWTHAALAAVRTTGKGIVFTGLTLILPILTWYFISDLKFQAQMGFFLSLLLVVNMLSAFTIHPLLISLVRPKFMARGVVVDAKAPPAVLPGEQPLGS